jgi:hypothetical protein
MESLPHLDLTPRVGRDITRCLHFISQQPWGKPRDRELDIDRGIAKAWSNPMSAPVRYRVRSTGLELRRIQIAQFVIVYAYLSPNEAFPRGTVSIRAVRHRRVRSVFSGVRETDAPEYGALRGVAPLVFELI